MTKVFNQILVAFLLFLAMPVMAQTGKLTGKVLAENKSPLAYANAVIFKTADTTFAGSAITDEAGNFSIVTPAAGRYFLRVSAIGFREFNSAVFEIATAGFTKDFGTISLTENTQTLKEVKIQALRPTITQEADRMVVSVEGTAIAAGSTAYEVLAKAPGVFIDQEGNIQLNGRTGLTIMLDGKLTYLSARDLRTMLEGMPAENLKNIEIITNPSAKYDAEGSSGILNINLKKNELRGLNGSIYAGYRYNTLHGYSAGTSINYLAGKWNSFLNLDGARRVWGRQATFTRIFYAPTETTYFDQNASESGVRNTPGLRFGTDYSFNPKHSFGFTANITYQPSDSEFLTQTRLGNAPNDPNLLIDASNFLTGKYTNYTGNLHYLGKLDTLGTTLSADLDFVQIRNKMNGNFQNYYDDLTSEAPLVQDFLLTDVPSGYDIFAAKIDYALPVLKDGKLEMGAKASRVISENILDFYFNNGPAPVIDPKRTDRFDYTENILAAYLNGKKKLSPKFDLQAGLRAEQTIGTGESFSTGETNKRKYLNWFPSVFLQQNVTENYQLNYNYSRRIQRPNYGNLNPFLFYRDPKTWIVGNPGLRPQFTHAFGLTQTIKKNYNLILNYQVSKDVISELPRLDVATASTIYYTGNVDRSQSLSFTVNAPVKITKNWDTSNSLLLSYNEFYMVVDQESILNDQLHYMIQSNHNVLLPLDVKLEVNLGYRGPGVWGLYQIAPQWWVHTGLKKTFLKDKLDVSLNATDLFKSQRLIFKTDIGGNVNDFDQYFFNRGIGLTVRYNFNRGSKVDNKQRNSSVEELNRT